MRTNRIGWNIIHNFANISVTGLSCSHRLYFRQPTPATNAITNTANAPLPARSIASCLLPKSARKPPNSNIAARNITTLADFLFGTIMQSNPQNIPPITPTKASLRAVPIPYKRKGRKRINNVSKTILPTNSHRPEI